jgi:hypothetical protein
MLPRSRRAHLTRWRANRFWVLSELLREAGGAGLSRQRVARIVAGRNSQ